MPNNLEQTLKSIQYQKAIAKKLLNKEPNPDNRVKLAKRIARLKRLEKETLQQIGDDLT